MNKNILIRFWENGFICQDFLLTSKQWEDYKKSKDAKYMKYFIEKENGKEYFDVYPNWNKL